MAAQTLRAQLLALLEDGPHELAALAAWVERTESSVDHELSAMRRLGLARVVGGGWARVGHVTAATVTGKPARKRTKTPSAPHFRPLYPRGQLEAFDDLEIEAQEQVGLLGVCQACGRRFYRDAESTRRFCSGRCEEAPPAPATVRRVVRGVEYDCTSIGSAEISSWPIEKHHHKPPEDTSGDKERRPRFRFT